MKDFIERMRNYEFDKNHLARLNEKFKLIMEIPGEFAEGVEGLDLVPNEPGIYFWVAKLNDGLASRRYRIYIGKADDTIRGRLNKYFNSFQPHCVNDFKIQAFRRSLPAEVAIEVYVRSLKEVLESNGMIGSQKKTERRKRVHEEENFESGYFTPLLYKMKKPSNEVLKSAYVAYYQESIRLTIADRNADSARE